MKYYLICLLFPLSLLAQKGLEKDIDLAYKNALIGLNYALENIPDEKKSFKGDMIRKNQKIAEIRLTKEINGIKIESTGEYLSYEVRIVVFKSYDELIKEGILKELPSVH